MITVTCAWNRNDHETRERAQQHRTETIRRQVAELIEPSNEGSMVCTLKDDCCEYTIDCSVAWYCEHIKHLMACHSVVAEVRGL